MLIFLDQKVYGLNMNAVGQIVICLLCFESYFIPMVCSHGEEGKRLLLDDNDVVVQLQKTIQGLTSRLEQLERSASKQSGSSYIRWGRKHCTTNNTEMVYTGYAAGSWYNAPGAAANPVCLPEDPNIVTLPFSISPSYHANLYGAEYEESLKNEHNKNVPCTVCRAKQTTTTIMIPGRNQCYPGWKMEYSGFLAAGRPDHPASSMYVCMDSTLEYLPGGTTNQDGYLFYLTLAQCGSLYCPPYKQNTPLACVVCSL